MPKLLVLGLLVASFGFGGNNLASAAVKGVQVVADEAHQRVDITIDGKPFTSYIWPTSLKKPVLYPLITDQGITVTRGYPLEPRPGERVDHPHHAGLWFNYGNVNGYDFWNNSDAIKPEGRSKMGSIFQKKIVSTKSGADQGELVVESVWITGENKEILKDTTKYVFTKRRAGRSIDQITTLEALDKVVFNDDKEGLLGMRVAHWLESADEKGGIFMDASGKPTKVDSADTAGATGVYLTSEGVKGGAAWGTRGRWCTLTGTNPEGHTVTIAIIDQPKNPGFPTYWHARGYGLFAANPLGRSIFDPKQLPFNYTIEKGQTATFRYRVILFSQTVDAAQMNKEADTFDSSPK
jgi:Methane oxygenase PmoA